MFYDNPKKFQSILASQRLLRRLDEIHLIDSSGNIIMSNIIDPTGKFVPPPEDCAEATEVKFKKRKRRKNRLILLLKIQIFNGKK